jgi:hypothetical protein
MRRGKTLSNVAPTTCLALLIVAGCTDKAKEPYERCEKLDQQGDLGGASLACFEATAADPKSKFGQLAAEKKKGIDAKLDEKRKQEETARAEAARKLAEEFEVHKKRVKFETITLGIYSGSDPCRDKGQPPIWSACRSAVKNGAPGDDADCEAVAKAAGCTPEPEKKITWCCPTLP